MWLFDGDGGLWGALRISHVFMAIMWMGLLWFFNFIQTPAYAELNAGARNEAFDKLTWRGLWWFRWAAAFTRSSTATTVTTSRRRRAWASRRRSCSRC
jgi:uncharacterized membrane protein